MNFILWLDDLVLESEEVSDFTFNLLDKVVSRLTIGQKWYLWSIDYQGDDEV